MFYYKKYFNCLFSVSNRFVENCDNNYLYPYPYYTCLCDQV